VGVVTAAAQPDETARAAVDGGAPHARIELYADRARRVLVGAVAVGPNADHWAAELGLAVRAQVGVDVLADLVHAFPTYPEVFEPAYAELARCLSGEDH
jgi:dihydrolipoamide dehydrogenase